MSENLFCSVLKEDEVDLEGNALTLAFSDAKYIFFLSREAMDKIARIVNERKDYEMNDVRKQNKEKNL